MKSSRRSIVVFATLVAVLTLTSALLLAVRPAPLSPDASASLFAIEAPTDLDQIFETKVPAQPGTWKYIYIHHSHSLTGNAITISQSSPTGLGDHFVIGNGDGAADGELQIGHRWRSQLPATPPNGIKFLPGRESSSISICLIGDFDRSLPTPTQMRRLTQLVSTLQHQYRIPAANVGWTSSATGPGAIGQYFPSTAFREQLLP